MTEPLLTRREELLADAALAWLDDADVPALDAVLRDGTARGELEALEATAGVAMLALDSASVPAADADLVRLVAKLHADAVAFFAARTAAKRSCASTRACRCGSRPRSC